MQVNKTTISLVKGVSSVPTHSDDIHLYIGQDEKYRYVNSSSEVKQLATTDEIPGFGVDYALSSELVSVSGNLQEQIDQKLDTTTFAALSGGGLTQTDLDAISGNYIASSGSTVLSGGVVLEDDGYINPSNDSMITMNSDYELSYNWMTFESSGAPFLRIKKQGTNGVNLESATNGGFAITRGSAVIFSHDQNSNVKIGRENYVADMNLYGNIIARDNVEIGGDLTVEGTTTTVNSEEVLIEDNIITLNSTLSGSPPSFLESGVKVNRGDQDPYYFTFRESDLTFTIGVSGISGDGRQAVATREDGITDGNLVYWDANDYIFRDAGLSVADISGGGNVDTTLLASISADLQGQIDSLSLDISGANLGRYVETIGNGSLTQFQINHNLGTEDVVVSVRNTTTKEIISTTIEVEDSDKIVVYFTAPPTSNQYSVTVLGIAGGAGNEGVSSSLLASVSGNLQDNIDLKLDTATFAALSGSSEIWERTGTTISPINHGDDLNGLGTIDCSTVQGSTEAYFPQFRTEGKLYLDGGEVEFASTSSLSTPAEFKTFLAVDQNDETLKFSNNGDPYYAIATENDLNNYLPLVGGTLTGNLTVQGNITQISGAFTTEIAQNLLVEDNIITVNNGEVGDGVTAGTAGLEVDRGGLDNYYFVLDDTNTSNPTFVIGVSGSEQAVATRTDLVDSNLVIWDDTNKTLIDAGVTVAALSGGGSKQLTKEKQPEVLYLQKIALTLSVLSAQQWKDLYVSNSSIYLGGNKLSINGSKLQLNEDDIIDKNGGRTTGVLQMVSNTIGELTPQTTGIHDGNVQVSSTYPYVVTSPSTLANVNGPAWRAFDGSGIWPNRWYPNFSTQQQKDDAYLVLDLGEGNEKALSSCRVYNYADSGLGLRTFSVYGSINDVDYDVLLTELDVTTANAWGDLSNFDYVGLYRYYKFKVESNWGNASAVAVMLIDFRETQGEYDSTVLNAYGNVSLYDGHGLGDLSTQGNILAKEDVFFNKNISFVDSLSGATTSQSSAFNEGGYQTNESSPYTITSPATLVNADGPAWKTLNGNTVWPNRWYPDFGTQQEKDDAYFVLDLGVGNEKVFTSCRVYGRNEIINTKTLSVYGSMDNVVYDVLLSESTEVPYANAWGELNTFNHINRYRYYKFKIDSNWGSVSAATVMEVDFREINSNSMFLGGGVLVGDNIIANSYYGDGTSLSGIVTGSNTQFDERYVKSLGNSLITGTLSINPSTSGGLDYESSAFNIGGYQTSESSPYTITSPATLANVNGPAWKALDGNTTWPERFYPNFSTQQQKDDAYFILDLGANLKVFSACRAYGRGDTKGLRTFSVYGSNDNVNFTSLLTQSADVSQSAAWGDLNDFENIGLYRYYKFKADVNWGSTVVAVMEVDFREAIIGSSSVISTGDIRATSFYGDGSNLTNVKQNFNTTNTSTPPLSGELTSAFGAPAQVGEGFTALLDVNGAGTNLYHVASNGSFWWYSEFTKAN